VSVFQHLGILVAIDNHSTAISDKMRDLVENIAAYWGLEHGVGAKPVEEFMSELEDKVHGAVRGRLFDVDTYSACADALTGLAQHGTDLINAHGDDTHTMKEALYVGRLMKEIADYYDINEEITYASDTNRQLRNSVKGLLERMDLPGSPMEGVVNANYTIKQAVLYDTDQGYAFAHNPNAASPYVVWSMHENDKGELGFEIGSYYQNKEEALVDYISRAENYAARYKLTEKPIHKAETPQLRPLVRFIDSQYREQFTIPSGESIRVTYPPSDGREPAEGVVKFMDETHADIKGSCYHMCQWAETMERLGAKFEPVTQLQDVVVLPFDTNNNEAHYYSYNRDENNTCTGSLHGDFGNDGERYRASWNDRENGLYNAEIQSEVQSVVYALRQDLLKDRASMLAYCQNYPEAKLSDNKGSNGQDYEIYGFKLETEKRQYFVNCFLQDRDSRFAIYAYADKPVPMREQENLKIYHADFYDPEISERMEIIAAVDDLDAWQKANCICAESEKIRLLELNDVDENGDMREVYSSPVGGEMPEPDPTISEAELAEYGYTYDGMHPLGKDRAMELFMQDCPIYLLWNDDTESLVKDSSEITNHKGIFGIDTDDWERSEDYRDLIAEKISGAYSQQEVAAPQPQADVTIITELPVKQEQPQAQPPQKLKKSNRGEDR